YVSCPPLIPAPISLESGAPSVIFLPRLPPGGDYEADEQDDKDQPTGGLRFRVMRFAIREVVSEKCQAHSSDLNVPVTLTLGYPTGRAGHGKRIRRRGPIRHIKNGRAIPNSRNL